jgi:PAS domain S-box-containing protein
METWQASVRTGELYEVEHRILEGSTGEYRWFLARSLLYTDSKGNTICWIGTCTDIHQQKMAEEQVRISEQHWHALAETLPQLVWTTSVDGWTDYSNRRMIDYTHATPEQLRGYGWSKFVHPDDYEGVLAARTRAFTTGTIYEMAYRLREGLTGNYRWFLARAMPVRDDSGQIIKWFGTATDIDEQKKIEEALRQSQARIRALIDSNIIGIISLEVEGEIIVEANETFLCMTGYSQEEVRSSMLRRVNITPPEQAPLFEQAIREIAMHGQHSCFETEVVCKDGNRLPILLGGVTFQDHPHRIISFLLDNSARKELEQRKDDFISMASHELRNPITALKLQTSLLERQLTKQGNLGEIPALAIMRTQIGKVTRLVEELLDVSKIQAGRLEYRQETVELDTLLQEVTDTLQQTCSGHALSIRGATHSNLSGDRDRLGQVFTNLLSNAIKYSPDARTVEIELSSSNEEVAVRVCDHGLGIAREQREHIFDRFYRGTGAKQKAIPGLGMGLYIVAEIVRHHGGTITVESAVGQGSTFTVTLPRSHEN